MCSYKCIFICCYCYVNLSCFNSSFVYQYLRDWNPRAWCSDILNNEEWSKNYCLRLGGFLNARRLPHVSTGRAGQPGAGGVAPQVVPRPPAHPARGIDCPHGAQPLYILTGVLTLASLLTMNFTSDVNMTASLF